MCKGQLVLLVVGLVMWVFWAYKAYKGWNDYQLLDFEKGESWSYRNIACRDNVWFVSFYITHTSILIFPVIIAIIYVVMFLWTWC